VPLLVALNGTGTMLEELLHSAFKPEAESPANPQDVLLPLNGVGSRLRNLDRVLVVIRVEQL
jgi:hypothetical protein